jgi:hypothetical protein
MYDSSKGTLYVLTIPESFTDLYNLPAGVLSRIKDTLTRELPVRVDGPGRVSLFVYDNDTFIVESFLDEPVDVGVTVARQAAALATCCPMKCSRRPAAGREVPRMPGVRRTRPQRRSQNHLQLANQAALLPRLPMPASHHFR